MNASAKAIAFLQLALHVLEHARGDDLVERNAAQVFVQRAAQYEPSLSMQEVELRRFVTKEEARIALVRRIAELIPQAAGVD